MTYFDTMTLYVIGSVVAVFMILLICVIGLIIKNRSKPRRPSEMFLCDTSSDIATCKSAPISRKQSPMIEKRGSWSHAYGAMEDVIVQHDVFPHSLYDVTTTGPVQPLSREEKAKSTSALEHQNIDPHISVQRCQSTDIDVMGGSNGQIWFTAHYDVEVHELAVTLIKLTHIPGREPNNEGRDPFVKISLLPDENVCLCSKIVRKTLNPVYNETFLFKVTKSDIKKQSIRFCVYDVDKRCVRHSVGNVIIPLRDLDMTSQTMTCRQLDSDFKTSLSTGEINVGLTYLPHQDKVKVIILAARNIRGTKDPDQGLFVRLDCHYGNRHIKTKQTMVQRHGSETNFNESFSFNIAGRNIEVFNFTVSLIQTSRTNVSNEEELGTVTLGSFMYARGAGLIHWQEMIAKTRSTVTRWHPLVVSV